MLRRKFTSASLAGLMTLAAACAARKPGEPLKPGFNLFSKQQDIELGRQAAQQVLQQMPVVKDQNLQNYIKNIGQRLASTKDAGDFPYSFTLLNQKEINAFALPGGPTFVFSGTIAAADNEAELAGVMAHEIAHVVLRHGTSQASKANLLQIPAVIAGAAAGQGALGQVLQLGLGVGLNGLFLKYSRTAESQADALGTHIMAEAGYNPIEMARFFEKLEAEGGSRSPEFLSDHPNPGNRVKAVEAEIQTLPQQQFAEDRTGQFQQAKQLVAQLPPAPKRQVAAGPQEGEPRGDGSGMRELRAGNFAVAYPENWQAYGGQGSNSVTLAPQQGLVQNQGGEVSIGYGAVMSYYSPQGARDLAGATQELVGRLRQANPSMRARSRARQVQVDGNPALLTTLSSQSPLNGQPETDVLLTVARPQGLFYMVFIAPSRNFAQLEPTFNQMFRSIRFAG